MPQITDVRKRNIVVRDEFLAEFCAKFYTNAAIVRFRDMVRGRSSLGPGKRPIRDIPDQCSALRSTAPRL